jgi:Cdc6-like AAA superfamily ATPase
MNSLDLNTIFERTETYHQIRGILANFDKNVKDVNFKKGIYLYGAPGTGKTHFATQLLKDAGYDIVKYDAGDIRNKSLIDTITSNNVSSCNVLDLMCGKVRKIAIIMDEIDGMHKGDKGGISALSKLIRQKKTKKQKLESCTLNPIICIGNYYMDKKIKELMKVCYTFELKTPEPKHMLRIVSELMPAVETPDQIVQYIQGDIRKLEFMHKLYVKKPAILSQDIQSIFQTKYYNEDYGKIVQQLFQEDIPLSQHNTFMNENDRTTVALLWHENVVDGISRWKQEESFPFYLKIIDNNCFADYVDRLTFQNQIWIFNEMSSLIKTFYNNRLYHQFIQTSPETPSVDIRDIRFTKILTKYSTEYSNMMFLYMLCQEMDMDKKDMVAFFQELRLMYGTSGSKDEWINEAEKMFQDTKIKKLDIKRVYRYLDKNAKKDVAKVEEEDEEGEEEQDDDA